MSLPHAAPPPGSAYLGAHDTSLSAPNPWLPPQTYPSQSPSPASPSKSSLPSASAAFTSHPQSQAPAFPSTSDQRAVDQDPSPDFFSIASAASPQVHIQGAPPTASAHRPWISTSTATTQPLSNPRPLHRRPLSRVRKPSSQSRIPNTATAPFRPRRNVHRPNYAHELHELISVVPDEPFGPHIGIKIPATPTSLTAVSDSYFRFFQPLLPSDALFRSALFRKSISDSTRTAYTSAYEQFCYTYPSASCADQASLDETILDYIEEVYEDEPQNASPKNIINILAML